jgi:hypothetical protein
VTPELSRRQRLTIGALLLALGAGVSLAIHFHLRLDSSPAWRQSCFAASASA